MRLSRKWVYSLVDQAASSGSNLLLLLLVARSTSRSDFSDFAIAWQAIVFLLALCRATLGASISLKAGSSADLQNETRFALATVLLASPITALFIVVCATVSTGRFGPLTLVSMFAGPVVLLQDLLRFDAFASKRMGKATASDTAWFLVLGAAFIWSLQHPVSPLGAVLAWLFGGLAALAVLLRLDRFPAFRGLLQWLRDGARTKSSLAAAGLTTATAVLVSSMLVAAIAGPEVFASLAAAAQLFAPVNTLLAVIPLTVLPATMLRATAQRSRAFLGAATLVATIAVVWASALMAAPDSLGKALLGDTWAPARSVLPFVGVQFSVGVFAITSTTMLVSLEWRMAVVIQALALSAGRVISAAIVAYTVGTATAIAIGETCVLLLVAIFSWRGSTRKREGATN